METWLDKDGYIGNQDCFNVGCEGEFFPEMELVKCNKCEHWIQDCECN